MSDHLNPFRALASLSPLTQIPLSTCSIRAFSETNQIGVQLRSVGVQGTVMKGSHALVMSTH